jgi:hypothetical protein
MKQLAKAPHSGHQTATCPGCACPLQDRSWRQCPRCRRELESCSGCGNCGRH